jgi:transcriptional regulator GlxA family with amidase domain
MPGPDDQTRVAILAYPEVTASTLYAMHDLFSAAGRDWRFITTGVPGEQRMQPSVVSTGSLDLVSANGAPIRANCRTDDLPRPDLICVPDFSLVPDDACAGRFDAEVAWLRQQHAAGATLACVCTSAIILAQTGLLDGHEATVHWAYASSLARHHPRLRINAERSLVITGPENRIVMAGGGTTHLDLCLYLIARFAGIAEASDVARTFLINWHQEGQRPFRILSGQQSSDALIARCQAWLADHYAEAAPVGAMIQLSGLPERTFARRFALATGMTPLDYVHALRLEEAKQMLETEDTPVEAIALEVGYQDSSFFGRLFRRRVGQTPMQYRRRFATLRHLLKQPPSTASPAKQQPGGTARTVAAD